MGSTSSTIKPARALFEKAEYEQARRAFAQLLEDGNLSREADIKLAICQFRLGNADALVSLQRNLAQSLTPEENALILRHEFIVLVMARRFSAALKLLQDNCPGADADIIHDVKVAMANMEQADTPVFMKRHERSVLLDLAYNNLTSIQDDYREDPSQFGSLLMILNDYLLLMIELKHNHRTRNSDTERGCRARIASADRHLARSLPRSLRSHSFRKLFRD